jgi:WD40 repeat protein
LETLTGKKLWEHQIDAGQSLSIFGFADGDRLLIVRGTYNGYLYVIDCATGKEVRSFSTAIFNQPGRATLSPDKSQILVCGSTAKPRVWDLNGKELPPLEGHKKWVSTLTFSADGKKVYTGGSDDFVLEREWPSGKVLRSIDLGRSDVLEMTVSGDGQQLEVIFWGERAIAFYDLRTGKRIPDLIDAHRGGVYGVGCAPDGALVTWGRDRTVRTWDLKSGKTTEQFQVELDLNANGFALSADGKRVAVPKGDIRGIHVYERATGKLLGTIDADYCSMKQLFFSPDGKFLAAINTDRGVAQVWATDSGNQVLKYTAQKVAYNYTTGAFSPDGRLFAFSDLGGVRFWNTSNWKEEKLLTAYGNVGLAFSPDGRMLATADIDGVRIYELSTKREREYSRPNDYASGSLRFSPGGRFIAWVAQRATIHVLDLYTGARLGPFSGHAGDVSGLVFTADDKALASSSADSTILIWDIASAAAKHSYAGGDADQAWQSLGSDDAKIAFAALRALAASPERSLRRIGDRIKPAKPLDKDWVAARLNDLDNEKFAERDRATRELEEAGERIVPFLEKLLAGKPSAEARERAERLVTKLRSPSSESERTAQTRRGLEVLEWIGSESARELVEILAKGADGAALTEEAKAMLARWRR